MKNSPRGPLRQHPTRLKMLVSLLARLSSFYQGCHVTSLYGGLIEREIIADSVNTVLHSAVAGRTRRLDSTMRGLTSTSLAAMQSNFCYVLDLFWASRHGLISCVPLSVSVIRQF